MYKLTIILKYLRRKLAPLFALLAVALCTGMVVLVISVMGGFLDMMTRSIQKLEGDLVVSSDVTGFPHYAELAEAAQALPEVEAAAPLVVTKGLITIHERTSQVEIFGIDPTAMDRVVRFRQALYWSRPDVERWLAFHGPGGAAGPPTEAGRFETLKGWAQAADLWSVVARLGAPVAGEPQPVPMIVPGIEVTRLNARQAGGSYDVLANRTLGETLTLTAVPLTHKGGLLEPVSRRVVVVNEFKSGLYEFDANWVFVPFDLLQEMLRMDPRPVADPNTGEPTGARSPPRATAVVVRAAPGVDLEQLRSAVKGVVLRLIEQHPELNGRLSLQTWRERHERFLGAVANEKMLITILFAVVSLVAFTMIAVVFYMTVLAKTRDVGTLRALGASRSGVAGIFIGYGLVIGVIGAATGLAWSSLVVWNLNEIQGFLSRTIGWQMWNPEIYYFDRIPGRLDPFDLTWILAASVASSVLGAVIPALAAARLDPVEALRYE